jgi:hypothetical protein
VAVRFDLCDRQLPGVCPTDEDARLRLVFQPVDDPPSVPDVGFHAFYTIRNDEIADAVTALRALAMIAPPQTGLLRVSPALAAADREPYATKVRAFVRRYGGDARLVRLTMNAQNLRFAAFVWDLRGVEKQGDAFVDMTIVGATDTLERIVMSGNPGFDGTPMADTPPGLRTALSQSMFDRADTATKRDVLATLVAVENPLTHTATTVACIGCHVSTLVMPARAAAVGIDPLALPGRYSSKFDLSTAGGKPSETSIIAIRALGYRGNLPLISQRVVNDTAQTLTEIEQRYPAP